MLLLEVAERRTRRKAEEDEEAKPEKPAKLTLMLHPPLLLTRLTATAVREDWRQRTQVRLMPASRFLSLLHFGLHHRLLTQFVCHFFVAVAESDCL